MAVTLRPKAMTAPTFTDGYSSTVGLLLCEADESLVVTMALEQQPVLHHQVLPKCLHRRRDIVVRVTMAIGRIWTTSWVHSTQNKTRELDNNPLIMTNL